MKQELFATGTRILAIKDVGPVTNGQAGIITGYFEQPFFFWKRTMYLCTFQGNVRCAMKPTEVDDFDHGRSIERLMQPAFPDWNKVTAERDS